MVGIWTQISGSQWFPRLIGFGSVECAWAKQSHEVCMANHRLEKQAGRKHGNERGQCAIRVPGDLKWSKSQDRIGMRRA